MSNIAITGGGTGGHLKIAKAIKEELNKRGVKPIFIGSTYGQDRVWFEDDDGFSKKYFFDTKGVVNQSFIGKFGSLAKIYKAMREVQKIFNDEKITKVFSVGGYSSAPASFASIVTKRELFIHEQNAIIGKSNRLLKPFAKEFLSSYFNSKVKDYPIDEYFFKSARERREVKTIIFLGGSQGARHINSFALFIAKDLEKMGIKIIHQTGDKDFLRVKEAYEEMGIFADVFNFHKNLIEKIKEADFAISRSGASTLWELVANQVPTLFVPYPYSAKDHQYYNAKFLADKGLCFLKREDELKEDFIFELLKKDFSEISKKLKDEISQNGAKEIVDLLLG